MASRKLDLRTAPSNYERTLDRFYAAAFGPSPALYRQISLCGWRPLVDHRTCNRLSKSLHRTDPTDVAETTPGIEVYETEHGMTIEVALADIKEDSLHLAIAAEKVIIRGERIAMPPKKGLVPHARRRSPQFQYFIPLPATISTGGFRAQLEGDIVRIDFEKRNC